MNFFRKPKCFIFRWLVCTQTHLNLCNVWQQVRFEMFEYPQKILKKCNHLFICIFPTHFYVIYLYSMKNKTFSRYNNALIIVERPELCKQALLIEILCSCRKLKETLRANRQYQSIIMSFFFLTCNKHISYKQRRIFCIWENPDTCEICFTWKCSYFLLAINSIQKWIFFRDSTRKFYSRKEERIEFTWPNTWAGVST